MPAAIEDRARVVRLERGTAPALCITDPTPGHQFEDIAVQVFGQPRVPDPPTPTMNGFVDNYARQAGPAGKPSGGPGAAAGPRGLGPPPGPGLTTAAARLAPFAPCCCSGARPPRAPPGFALAPPP